MSKYRKRLTRKQSTKQFKRGSKVVSRNRRPTPTRGGIRL